MVNRSIRVALAGNPNVGKSTLFNALTGARQHVGNFPGVTVEKKSGKKTYKGVEIEFVDLPGTYSLTAYSLDEIVARDYIIEERPDVVVQIVDATNLERNLYLTTQLMELGAKVVIALNMSDLAEARGDAIDRNRMEEFLEIPVIRTVGSKGEGINKLLQEVVKESQKGEHHEHEIGYGKKVETKIREMERILEKDTELMQKYPPRWFSVKLLEGDENILKKLMGKPVESQVKTVLDSINREEFEATMADKRYEAINAVLPQVCTRCVERMSVSDMIDHVFTNKYLGIPIFLALLWGAFELTFTVATPFMDFVDIGFGWLAEIVTENVQPDWLGSFLGDGIIGGVGAVIIFIPNIFILFFLLSVLEDSGYLSRAAFIMDKLMYKIGLQGKSFVPMLMGFGCNVPAIMATRSIEDKKDRLITILVNPFISCGARLPVFVLLAGAFFGRAAGSVIFSIYILGIVVAILSAKLFRSTILAGKPAPFIMELPPYRLPTLKTSLIHMWERGAMYLKKAGSIILLGVIFIWLLASYPSGVEYGSEESYAGELGKAIAPVFEPLGFDWKIAIALIFGFVAKEIVVAGLGTLYGVGEDEEALSDRLQAADSGITSLNALGLMVFTLLYMPCIAVTSVIRKETGSWKWTLFSLAYGTALAWIAAFIIYQGGRLLGYT
jgi:ferrous iron transport protein B